MNNRIYKIVIVESLTLLVISGCSSIPTKNKTEEMVPTYICYHVKSGEIKIDGILNENVWQKVPVTCSFKTFDNKTAPYKFTTYARLLWDQQYLYICFFCQDNDIWATMKKRDAPLYEEEVIEVYIDADNDKLTYTEIEINPLGAIFDAIILNDGIQTIKNVTLNWTCLDMKLGIKIKGTIENRKDKDKYWTVEIAIPFSSLPDIKSYPPEEGEVFGINMIRYERTKEKFWHLTWAPCYTEGWPHIPNKFGRVIFKRS